METPITIGLCITMFAGTLCGGLITCVLIDPNITTRTARVIAVLVFVTVMYSVVSNVEYIILETLRELT